MSRPRVLWVTDEVPDRRLGGGSIRQSHLLHRLAGRADVDLLVVGRLEDGDLRSALRDVHEMPRPELVRGHRRWARSRLSLLPGLVPAEVALASPFRRALSGRLSELISTTRYDVVQVEHEWLAPLIRCRPAGAAGTRWFITLHNLLSVRLHQAAAAATRRRVRLLLRRDALNAERLERSILRSYGRVITVSPRDDAVLGGRTAVVPNGVDLEEFQPSPLPCEPRLIFTASWNWEPNQQGAVWAAHELLPRVRAAVPGASLVLVGRQPTPVVEALAELPGVETHFDVPSVRPHLQAARVALVPLAVGSGTRLKALEAMASGRPVVGTPIGLEGLGLVDGVNARVAADAAGLAAAAAELLQDDAAAGRLARSARSLVESDFGWDRVCDLYLGLLGSPDRTG